MKYSEIPNHFDIVNQFKFLAQLKAERKADIGKIEAILNEAQKDLNRGLKQLNALPEDKKIKHHEPDDLKTIRQLRPSGPRKLWKQFDREKYLTKVEGAFLGRAAGCTLGAIVEGSPIEHMEDWAKEMGDKFPPADYWSQAPHPFLKRYNSSRGYEYTRDKMNGIPVDDDMMYTLLGLLVVEDYGANFTTEDNAKAWLEYLPFACTAEDIVLKNLKKKIHAKKAADIDNPYCEWIGADIRSDPWGYMAPAWPEKAAEMAYRDAYLTHRRNGIYGAMYFSAAIAAAFAVRDPVEALHIGLSEIPAQCRLAKDIRWALSIGNKIRNYRQAREQVDRRFKGMHPAHTCNNACLTVFGIMIGGRDFTKVISETVVMGLDNDCTAATAGSIVGAVIGKHHIPRKWYRNFNNTIYAYLNKHKQFKIDDVIRRFAVQASRCWKTTFAMI